MKTKKIKICHVITTFEMGGAQLSTLRLIKILSQNPDFEISLIYGEEGPLEEQFKSVANLSLLKIPSLKRKINIIYDSLSLLKFVGILKKYRFDVVHTHCTKPSIVGRLAAVLTKTPCIHTYHGFGHDYFKNPLLQNFIILTEKIINSFSKAVVFVCEENLKRAIFLKLISDKKQTAHIINDVLEFENIKRERNSFDKEELTIGSILSFKEQKRPFELLDLAVLIAKKYPLAKFFFIGDGPLLAKCKDMAKVKGLNNMVFTGTVSNVNEYYKKMDLFIGCSRYEGLSMAELECLYYKVPMVITKAGGIKNIMQHGKQGYFYEYPELETAVDCCLKILSEKFDYLPLKEEFWDDFKPENVCMKYEKLYLATNKGEGLATEVTDTSE